MIESGRLLETISEKIAILKTEINQSGFLALTNIHKHCENFVKRFLNIVYEYELVSLNDPVVNFPGLDIGDKVNGVAYQVSSEKTSDKVDETLIKVIRFRHYNDFPQIRVFILSGKQGSYSITTITRPYFIFDWKKNVVDFNDILKDIQHFSLNKLQQILGYLESELPYTIGILKNKNQDKAATLIPLIDVNSSLDKSKMLHFEHWACNLVLRGGNFSAAALYTKLKEYYNTPFRKNLLCILNNAFQKKANAQEIQYKQGVSQAGASNHHKEAALVLKANSIRFEYAQYKSDALLLTNLLPEAGGLFSLLFFCKQMYGNFPLQIELDIDISTNGELIFYPMSSLFSVRHTMNNHKLDPKSSSFSTVIHNLESDSLINLMQEIIHGFVASEMTFGHDEPFLTINEPEQLLVYDFLRPHLE